MVEPIVVSKIASAKPTGRPNTTPATTDGQLLGFKMRPNIRTTTAHEFRQVKHIRRLNNVDPGIANA